MREQKMLDTLRQYRNFVKNAIKRSLPNCMDRFPQGIKFQEPDYTAGLTIGLPGLLNTARLARYGLRFGGCFIHQSPYVTYKDGNTTVTRELGDLLVLCRELKDGVELFNAALLQLKMADGKKEVEEGQLKIYTAWPAFDFGRVCTKSPQYDIYPKTVTQGTMYSFVHKPDGINRLQFTVASPDRLVTRDGLDRSKGTQLQEFLADFIIWQSGRAIESQDAYGFDSWSNLIWDLVKRLKGAFFNRKRINVKHLDREHGAFFQALLSQEQGQYENEISDYSDYIRTRTVRNDSNVEGRGLGLLLIDKNSPTNEIDVNEGR